TIESHLEIIDEIISEEAVAQAETKVRGRKPKKEIEVVESSEVSTDKRETVATPPSGTTSIVTEDANSPGDITIDTPVVNETDKPSSAAPKSIDPEITDALKQYQQEVTKESISADETPIAPRPPKPGEIVETSARAEDIPSEFIAVNAETDESQESTDKVQVEQPKAADASNARSGKAEPPVEELSEALDEVVAKFEEELDKAAKQ
ncbi:MAG: hypothetical protein D6800_08305, partial [Candidatus Zixiibacteriota bacterium]